MIILTIIACYFFILGADCQTGPCMQCSDLANTTLAKGTKFVTLNAVKNNCKAVSQICISGNSDICEVRATITELANSSNILYRTDKTYTEAVGTEQVVCTVVPGSSKAAYFYNGIEARLGCTTSCEDPDVVSGGAVELTTEPLTTTEATSSTQEHKGCKAQKKK